MVAAYRYRQWTRFPFAPRHGWRARSFFELTPGAEHEAYDLSLKALDRPEAILRATREVIAAPPEPGRPCETWMDLPGPGLIRLSVPVNSPLEARAREWTRSPDKDYRKVGAATLGHFHSDANVAILKRLLDDPGVTIFTSQNTRGVERTEHVHEVREEAYSILKAWGYEVPGPVRKELVP